MRERKSVRERERECVCNFEQGIETGLEVELKFSHALKSCNPLKLENLRQQMTDFLKLNLTLDI